MIILWCKNGVKMHKLLRKGLDSWSQSMRKKELKNILLFIVPTRSNVILIDSSDNKDNGVCEHETPLQHECYSAFYQLKNDSFLSAL